VNEGKKTAKNWKRIEIKGKETYVKAKNIVDRQSEDGDEKEKQVMNTSNKLITMGG
jgi:hypothetical protein